jgi:hypothetical protein
MVFDTLSKSGIEVTTLRKADRVTFEYYQGRYELHHLHFRKAREHLLYCFDNVHLQTPKQQRYTILTISLIQTNSDLSHRYFPPHRHISLPNPPSPVFPG